MWRSVSPIGCSAGSSDCSIASSVVPLRHLPDAASLDRTEAAIHQMSTIAMEHPGVASAVAFPGLSINGFVNAPNAGIVFVTLKPSGERATAELSAGAIVQSL